MKMAIDKNEFKRETDDDWKNASVPVCQSETCEKTSDKCNRSGRYWTISAAMRMKTTKLSKVKRMSMGCLSFVQRLEPARCARRVVLLFLLGTSFGVVTGAGVVVADEATTSSGNSNCDISPENSACPIAEDSSDIGSTGPSNLPSEKVGNPINLMTGNKFQKETDFAIPGATLSFNRLYNSANADNNVGIGQGWHHTYAVSLFDSGNGSREIVQSNGSRIRFNADGTDEQGRPLMRGSAPHYGYVVQTETHHEWHLPDSRTLVFQGSYLVRIDWPDQRRLEMFYRSGRLRTVTDETGRLIRFEYHAGVSKLTNFDETRFGIQAGHLASVTLPDSTVIEYDYDNHRNLTRVRFPDETSREYHYEDENYPNHLTGLTDRTGVRFASWSYDGEGRAISSEYSGGVEKVTLQYPERKVAESGEVVETRVTNSLGALSVYTWQKPAGAGQEQLLSSTGAGCATCPPTGMEYTYDEQGRLILSTATGQGNTHKTGSTRYIYDQQGRISELRLRDASGAEQLLERHEYDSNDLTPARTFYPSINPDGERMTEVERNDQLLPVKIIKRGYKPVLSNTTDLSSPSVEVDQYTPVERITTFVYNDKKQLAAIDGPRDDVADVTRLEYDEAMRLSAVVSPLSPTLHLNQYDPLGRVLSFQLGTQREVFLTRDPEGRVIESRQGELVNSFTYDANGRMSSVSDSDGRTVRMTHNAAGQLLSVIDDLENEQAMDYDTEGRLIAQQKLGNDGILIHSLETLFDENGQQRQFTEQQLTHDGNLDTRSVDVISTNGAGEFASSFIDSTSGQGHQMNISQINRLVEHVRADGAQTRVGLDTADNVMSVEDARGNITRDFRDDFGQSTILVNADTGVQIQRHDAAGNLVFRQDAQGRISQYSYDAANRLIERTDDDGITRWQWDPQSGELAEVSNEGSVERFSYNASALLSSHVRVIDGHTFETTYRYDARNRLISTRLPDGQTLQHHYHESGPNRGQLKSISRGQWGGLREESLITDIDLDARDGASGYVSAAGIGTQQRYSAAGQIRSVQVGSVLDLRYTVDNGGRIVGITENGDEQRYGYNADGLIVADTLQGLFSYGYDHVGNRISRRVRQAGELSEEEIYRYAEGGTGNRLLERTDTVTGVAQPYTYNATGSPVQRGQLRYEYDAKEQLTTLYRDEELLARYTYNGFGERIKKVVYSQGKRPTVTYFLYSGSTLVAEAGESGEITAQYQYLEDHRPVLMLQGKQVFVIHTDHLGTPRVVSDEQGDIRWQASYTPFGKAIITQADIELPLRFPGQYADAESGTHYNYLRDYDPELGRYLRSDPIGLGGGLNTYAYVASNPLGAIDPLGLNANAVVNLDTVSDEVRRIVDQRGLRPYIQTTGTTAANQPIPPPRPGVPATSVLRGLTRVNALVTLATVSYTMGYAGAAFADALYFSRADHAEVLAHIRRYDPDYNPVGVASQVDREGIRALGSELSRAMGDFLIANANSCTAAVESTQLWYDANWAINGAGSLPPVALTQQQIDDLAYEDYKANGGTLSRNDWDREGQPYSRPPRTADNLEGGPLESATRVSGRFVLEGGPSNGTVYRADNQGNITSYATYDSSGNILTRVDVTGAAHNGVRTPHVLEYGRNILPDGTIRVQSPRGNPRRAREDEIP